MSRPAAAAPGPLPFDLVLDDGEPLETEWHVLEHSLLREVIGQAMVERGRTDFYLGTNMFVYYSVAQAKDVAEEDKKGGEQRTFRGPDVFWVGGVDPNRKREVWIAWEEGGRLPDVIVELLSPSTAHKDRTEKKDLYARVFRTSEYFLYDPNTQQLDGFRLEGGVYQPIVPDGKGRLWSEQLGVSLGVWQGIFERRTADWVRLFRADGDLVPMKAEIVEIERQQKLAERQRAEEERQRAEAERQQKLAERQRAEAAEAEVARLRALLEGSGRG